MKLVNTFFRTGSALNIQDKFEGVWVFYYVPSWQTHEPIPYRLHAGDAVTWHAVPERIRSFVVTRNGGQRPE